MKTPAQDLPQLALPVHWLPTATMYVVYTVMPPIFLPLVTR